MSKILDRYVVREVMLPFLLWLLVITFVLQMPPILEYGEKLIEKGVGWPIIVRALLLLVPQALGVTIPIALLLGILIGLGRLSADREFVAMQACGISIFRLLRPVALLAVVATGFTGYVMIEALPDANQAFREIMFGVVASRAETDVKPRVFFEDFRNRVLYVQDVESSGGWRHVFMADSTRSDETTVYFAQQGRLIVDRSKRTVDLVLERGTRHSTYVNKPDAYEGGAFDRLVLSMDADTVFPKPSTLLKGDNEMTIAELRQKAAEATKAGTSAGGPYFTIQQKFSIPAACAVLALIGLGLGLTNRKEGKLAGFVLGFAVIMIYYFLLWTARALALGGRINPSFAPWIANVVLGAAGLVLVWWRSGSADQPLRIPLPSLRAPASSGNDESSSMPRRRASLSFRLPQFSLLQPRLLDRYVSRQYLRVFAIGLVGLLGLFYISAFMDMADKLFRGTATTAMLLQYMYFATPQFIYYIIPIAALLAALVVFGLLTRNSELIVMRACGVSLYRSAMPLVLFAGVLSGVLFELQEHVLADWNRRADAVRHEIRGFGPQTFGVLDRRWVIGAQGDIYHYEYFDPRLDHFSRLMVFALDTTAWQLASLTYSTQVVPGGAGPAEPDSRSAAWDARDGWRREFGKPAAGKPKGLVAYSRFATRAMAFEPPGYFKTDEPEADRMNYDQLKRYIAQLQASGFYAVPYMVQLQRKVAFPFVTLIMTLLAVPFAVTIGRSGAMYGVGVAIVLSISYWIMLSVFGAVGAGGLISPSLAAWAPNILFGSAAAYMVLTVRT
jgi:LPS export ABC transporter permease LptF/LPS export ABC transporter permease LptG